MRTGFLYSKPGACGWTDGDGQRRKPVINHLAAGPVRRSALRAQSHATLTSSATVLADDPALTVQVMELDASTQASYPQENLRQPVRIVIDSQNRVTPAHRLCSSPAKRGLRTRR